jgi:hypothetical protein
MAIADETTLLDADGAGGPGPTQGTSHTEHRHRRSDARVPVRMSDHDTTPDGHTSRGIQSDVER